MADETDFLDLYGKLSLEPGCSLEDFKQAYRRHVALWHPDRRRHGSRADMLAASRLQRLTAQYGAAMDFHRRHGRLPGAPMVPRVAEAASEQIEDFGPAVVASTAAKPQRTAQRALSTRWWLAIVATAVGVAVWSMWPETERYDADPEQDVVASAGADVQATHATLSLGMTPEEVMAVEGEPTWRTDERWEYGPSWISFDRGAVVDWHSSPLHALHVASSRPRP